MAYRIRHRKFCFLNYTLFACRAFYDRRCIDYTICCISLVVWLDNFYECGEPFLQSALAQGVAFVLCNMDKARPHFLILRNVNT
jgi:hypothetical protein